MDAPENLHDLPFDQYQRYRLIADVCGAGGSATVLDVGGRTGVLRRFLPDVEVTLVDPEPSDQSGLVLGSGDRLPFRDDSFDAVVASDTLEHVPPAAREAFVRECCRVARRQVVLAGPYEQQAVVEAEELLQRFLQDRIGEHHRYLEEHRALGLPDRAAVERWCRDAGARDVTAIGHGSLERWLGLMTLALYLDADAPARPAARRLHRFYNAVLYPGDHRGVCYRQVVVASFDGAPPPRAEALLGPAELPAEALDAFGRLLEELAQFDRERDLVQGERTRLVGELDRALADVAGHARSLTECREDLRGHRESLAVLRADLDGHRARLAETEAELEDHRTALATTTADLEQHRVTVGALRSDLDGARLAHEALAQDLSAHQDVLAEVRREESALREHNAALQTELGAVREEARAIEAELLHKTRWRRKIRGWLGRG